VLVLLVLLEVTVSLVSLDRPELMVVSVLPVLHLLLLVSLDHADSPALHLPSLVSLDHADSPALHLPSLVSLDRLEPMVQPDLQDLNPP
jgi:hypothetical protein